ncbi:RHS repeat-associated core domain-containing protein, partial [Frateuria sp. GZRR35]|uniref:RHS repeat-associated core domain-containing protein n=1 Tax=Frateuria sp. GZRR35 TaxID=3351536 RepID=UPI003EDB7022
GAAWARVAAVVLTLLSLSLGGQAQAAETTTYVLTDVQGTVLAREDAQGNIIARYDYRPYGKQQAGPVAAGPGYTGHVGDPDSGLVYMQQRYYDPEVGRFLSVDPVTAYEKPMTNFNRYVYALSNPYKFTDPDGRNGVTFVGGVITESWNALNGQGFDGDMVMGALKDGYDGEGDGFARAAFDDATTFIPTGALAGGAIKLTRALATIVRVERLGGLAKMSGMLRSAAAGKGNFGIGSATAKQSNAMGRAWVGKEYTVASDGKTLVSKDGLRQYRPPAEKNSSHAETGVQANFEQRVKSQGEWQSNAHLDITN